ncbi:hypothetical protein Q9L58_000258 [Maublancomyces gigas]|uniref:SGNH hydrolase-type esterase domain-containing protein n=1 Tax=Discina gigas TaxID=1032678 RepID=A0ABR3GXC6_9PEZI
MRVSGILSLFSLSLIVQAAPLEERANPVAVFLLAGDSTTATQAPNGGGWGDGFKNFTMGPSSIAVNYGHNGATTSSFRSGGDWAKVLADVVKYAPTSAVYVTIQFGHNDMNSKLADYVETYKAGLRQMAADVKGKGGKPVIVTPLSRRSYTKNGTIADTLGPWAGYAIGVARETNTTYIDLWQSSVHYLEQIGEVAARRLDSNVKDSTHVNVKGSIVFGRMVSDLLVRKICKIGKVTKLDTALSNQIWSGIATY